ncbi:hypothetical protein LTR84_005030 [Exophiala bonariae]|uniref:Uncharacterized protein n=1 Tax=Exophiala bonariae TaxID=1690606 RepID=A0AAV9NRA6_9EURO|nr:hypothetical protein LTR84_005030 [Exophiala bonariae]
MSHTFDEDLLATAFNHNSALNAVIADLKQRIATLEARNAHLVTESKTVKADRDLHQGQLSLKWRLENLKIKDKERDEQKRLHKTLNSGRNSTGLEAPENTEDVWVEAGRARPSTSRAVLGVQPGPSGTRPGRQFRGTKKSQGAD